MTETISEINFGHNLKKLVVSLLKNWLTQPMANLKKLLGDCNLFEFNRKK